MKTMTRRDGTLLRAQNGGELPAYAWPGGYNLIYWCADNEPICATCANEDGQFGELADPQWRIVAVESADTYEHDMSCESCGTLIVKCYKDSNAYCEEGCASTRQGQPDF